MKKRKTKAERVREFFEKNREEFERGDRLLLERIEHHRRRSEEDRAARGET